MSRSNIKRILNEELNKSDEAKIKKLARDEFDKMMPKSVWGVKWQPEFDIAQNEKGITITADIPGMEEKDINIEVSSGVLTISGEKKIERDEKKDNYYLSERMSGYFSRSISIPETVDTDHIKAVFKNGVLQLNLPFSEKAKTVVKKVKIQKE